MEASAGFEPAVEVLQIAICSSPEFGEVHRVLNAVKTGSSMSGFIWTNVAVARPRLIAKLSPSHLHCRGELLPDAPDTFGFGPKRFLTHLGHTSRPAGVYAGLRARIG